MNAGPPPKRRVPKRSGRRGPPPKRRVPKRSGGGARRPTDQWWMPPSTVNSWPVQYAESSLARNSTMLAMSPGWP